MNYSTPSLLSPSVEGVPGTRRSPATKKDKALAFLNSPNAAHHAPPAAPAGTSSSAPASSVLVIGNPVNGVRRRPTPAAPGGRGHIDAVELPGALWCSQYPWSAHYSVAQYPRRRGLHRPSAVVVDLARIRGLHRGGDWRAIQARRAAGVRSPPDMRYLYNDRPQSPRHHRLRTGVPVLTHPLPTLDVTPPASRHPPPTLNPLRHLVRPSQTSTHRHPIILHLRLLRPHLHPCRRESRLHGASRHHRARRIWSRRGKGRTRQARRRSRLWHIVKNILAAREFLLFALSFLPCFLVLCAVRPGVYEALRGLCTGKRVDLWRILSSGSLARFPPPALAHEHLSRLAAAPRRACALWPISVAVFSMWPFRTLSSFSYLIFAICSI